MFTGSHEHSVDNKGRIIIPSKFREELGEKFIITLGLDGCLFIYPMDRWEEFVLKLQGLQTGKLEIRQLQRYFLAYASEVEFDKQGRVLIPTNLREKAEIQKNVILVGMMGKIEIWDKEKWENSHQFDDADKITEKMAELNLSF